MGGIKAVIWTDVWQAMWMLSGFVGILIMAGIDFDGFSNILEKAKNGNRLYTDNDVLFDRKTCATQVVSNAVGNTLRI